MEADEIGFILWYLREKGARDILREQFSLYC